jgi:hypothetical protein
MCSIFKQQMKKYLALIYLSLSVMSFAQFKDNVFDQEQSKVEQRQSQDQSAQVEAYDPNGEYSDENVESIGPGNPGEPAPIDGMVPFLLLVGLGLIFYYQRKNKKISI